MNAKQSASFRMDERVVFTMVGTCILAAIIFAFRFASDKPYNNVAISFPADSVFVNDVISFSVDKKAGKEFGWDFGDGSVTKDNNFLVTHAYKEAKTYTVKVMVDNTCTDIQTVMVYERKKSFTPSMAPDPRYLETAFVNDDVTFYDVSPYSKSWEWYFEGSPEVYSRERSVKYTFKKTGNRQFILKTNGKDDLAVTRFILINPKPADATVSNGGGAAPGGGKRPPSVIIIPEKPVTPPVDPGNKPGSNVSDPAKPEPVKPKQGTEISASGIGDLLYLVNKGNKSAADFKEYFCDNDIKVSEDGQQYSFSDFCNKLKGIKSKKIKKIDVFITAKNLNNCILSIQVTIKYKSFIGTLL